jgi:hypothetical protein
MHCTTYRILQAVIGISKYFLKLPDHTQKGMRDYYDVISKPMCFRESECYLGDAKILTIVYYISIFLFKNFWKFREISYMQFKFTLKLTNIICDLWNTSTTSSFALRFCGI